MDLRRFLFQLAQLEQKAWRCLSLQNKTRTKPKQMSLKNRIFFIKKPPYFASLLFKMSDTLIFITSIEYLKFNINTLIGYCQQKIHFN